MHSERNICIPNPVMQTRWEWAFEKKSQSKTKQHPFHVAYMVAVACEQRLPPEPLDDDHVRIWNAYSMQMKRQWKWNLPSWCCFGFSFVVSTTASHESSSFLIVLICIITCCECIKMHENVVGSMSWHFHATPLNAFNVCIYAANAGTFVPHSQHSLSHIVAHLIGVITIDHGTASHGNSSLRSSPPNLFYPFPLHACAKKKRRKIQSCIKLLHASDLRLTNEKCICLASNGNFKCFDSIIITFFRMAAIVVAFSVCANWGIAHGLLNINYHFNSINMHVWASSFSQPSSLLGCYFFFFALRFFHYVLTCCECSQIYQMLCSQPPTCISYELVENKRKKNLQQKSHRIKLNDKNRFCGLFFFIWCSSQINERESLSFFHECNFDFVFFSVHYQFLSFASSQRQKHTHTHDFAVSFFSPGMLWKLASLAHCFEPCRFFPPLFLFHFFSLFVFTDFVISFSKSNISRTAELVFAACAQ